MVRPAATDPPQVQHRLWHDVRGVRAFDVGTNCGQSLPELLRRFDVVVGFEPCRDSFELASAGFAPTEILNIAVSDHDGTVVLAEIEGEQADTGQLVSPGTHGMEWDPGDWDSSRVRKVTVECRTLDTLAGEYSLPDFVKVDTEGHELDVLRGAPGVLRRQMTAWLIEFHNPELHKLCKDILESAGHEVETIRHPHYPPGSHMWYQHGWIKARPGRWSD